MATKKDAIEETTQVDMPDPVMAEVKPTKASEIKPAAPLKIINEEGKPTQVFMP